MVFGSEIRVNTKGETDILDITDEVRSVVAKSAVKNGIVTVFVSGSTAGVTTVEYEPGLVADLRTAFERIAPRHAQYQHDSRWGDGNGYAHVRASLLGASLTAPVRSGRVALGTWQQIVFVDFDNRPRSRDILVQVVGE
ncbi:MAG: secondary thiamine-phosphate synthase enzyme YjbQ [Chloroflexi bacterium]|nr:secondary thiamine-phosphate synthase enzyme YjbQ [Chloroflexota bacterium]